MGLHLVSAGVLVQLIFEFFVFLAQALEPVVPTGVSFASLREALVPLVLYRRHLFIF